MSGVGPEHAGGWEPEPAPLPEDLLPERSTTYGHLPGRRAGGNRPRTGLDHTRAPGHQGAEPVPAPAAGRSGPRRRWPRITAFVVLGLVVLLIAGFISTWMWADSKITYLGPLADYPGRPAQGVGTNWLLAGSDGRDTLTPAQQQQLHTGSSSAISGARTDTILLLHYGSTGPDLISIPRDSYVEIPAYKDSGGTAHPAQHNKINAAYDEGGEQLLVQTVETNFGVHIDNYLEIGFLGIVNMVNEAGGVHMCLAQAVHDSYSGADLNAGRQTLNGTQALAYVRSRYSLPNSDVSRMSDQQVFIRALAGAALRPGVLANPFAFYPFTDAVLNSVATNSGTSLLDLVRMAWHCEPLDSGGGTTGTMPIANEGYQAPGVGDAVLVDQQKAAEVIAAVNQDKPVPAGLLNYLG